jgi:protein-arginine kinase activator protein McsA
MEAPVTVSEADRRVLPLITYMLPSLSLIRMAETGSCMTEQALCTWCGKSFKPKIKGGNVKRFCCAECKNAFYTAARAWVNHALAEGRLAIRDLQEANATSCTER